ncbi:MAG: hypothetical protein RLZZ511_3860 [Cyanobacteriota bacterium]|jgi:hypothetical protein
MRVTAAPGKRKSGSSFGVAQLPEFGVAQLPEWGGSATEPSFGLHSALNVGELPGFGYAQPSVVGIRSPSGLSVSRNPRRTPPVG